MKPHKLLDKAIVAALLLAYIPGLAEDAPPESAPIALTAPQIAESTEDENPASGL